MRKFKLGGNKDEKPSEETVSRYQDFGKVVTDYERLVHNIHRKPLYKDKRLFLFVLIALLLLYLIWQSSEARNDDQNQKKDESSGQHFSPANGLKNTESENDETLHPDPLVWLPGSGRQG